VDELNAALGVVRACAPAEWSSGAILPIQHDLISLMGEIGSAHEDRQRYRDKGYAVITPTQVEGLTSLISEAERSVSVSGWAMPGGSAAGAALDTARTICRRAERRVIEAGFADTEPQRYLNRLSDLCWIWARQIESGKASI